MPHLRSLNDIPAQRQAIYDQAVGAFSNFKPLENATHRLEVADVGYERDYNPTLADEKKAILSRQSLNRPLKGTLRLVDQETGSVLDEQRTTLAQIPHLNNRGLFVRKGVVWSLRNQQRLRPGVYARRRADGGTEAQFNVQRGRGFRVALEPRSGLFKFDVGQSTTRLYPLLRSLGVSDDQIREAWGDELFKKNYRAPSGNDKKDLLKVARKMAGPEVSEDLALDALRESLTKAELDPETTEATLGRSVTNVTPDVLVQASGRVLGLARGEGREDVRDSQAFQSVHSAEDFIRERLQKDPGGSLRKLLWRASKSGKLDKSSGVLNKAVESLFSGTGLAHAIEDINPIEVHDMRQAITRLGDGGISSVQAVSRDARGVQPSYLGVIDAIRGPESERLGLDMRATDSALKGDDNRLYTRVRDRKGEVVPVSAQSLSRSVVAFPGELEKGDDRVMAVKDGEVQFVLPDEVDYEIPTPQDMFSRASNMVPMIQGIKGQRALMGARMSQQALPLAEAEAPLVSTLGADGEPLSRAMGEVSGAVRARGRGVVRKVEPDFIEVDYGGERVRHDLYNNYPTARKTFLHNTPLVEPGQAVDEQTLLARSNFTDEEGNAAFGRNLRAAFVVAEGDTLEDAFVISESAARKMAGENMYRSEVDLKDVQSTEKSKYRAIYSNRWSPSQYDKLDDQGVIKVGQKVEKGDPLILAFGRKSKRAVGATMDSPKSIHTDMTETWDHEAPGVVTDVRHGRSGIQVAVRASHPMNASDKLSNRFGLKGVISRVVPDDQMPTDSEGQPIEVMVNAMGIISRTNPSALAEAALGKVAQKTGKRYDIRNFDTPEGVIDFALNELKAAGIPERETLYDPRTGAEIPDVFTGSTYLMQLHHTAEGKSSARDQAGYTMEGLPAKGGPTGSKRIGTLDVTALVAAGATDFLRDAKIIRGQRNDEYWRAVKDGGQPRMPDRSFANEAFINRLRGAGVNVIQDGTTERLAPLLDSDVQEMSSGEIKSGETFDFETMRPVPGGLFDPEITGGADGNRFAHIKLPAPVPHPLFIEPIQRMLGLTGKQLQAVMSGEEDLQGRTGPEAVKHALSEVDIDRMMKEQVAIIKSGRKTKRDRAVKTLNYLKGLSDMEVDPADLMITHMPVVPPALRPIASSSKMDIVHDLNYLYNDLIEASKNYQQAKELFGDQAGDEYQTLSQAVQAVTGVHEPVSQKSIDQGVKGILKSAIGVQDTPKAAAFQRKVIGSAVDTVGRGTITSDPNLDMDHVGVPEEMAWTIFRPYIIRRLVQQGNDATTAIKAIDDRSESARSALVKEMEVRPVVYNRAPALHQYNYVAGYGRLRKDNAIGMSYPILGGMNADFDGDQINIHVPASEEAVKNALDKLLPSRNLISAADFQPRMTPMQDYIMGLHMASTPKETQDVREFDSEEEAIKAYKQGRIGPRDPIRIKS